MTIEELRDLFGINGHVTVVRMMSISQIAKEIKKCMELWEEHGYKCLNDVPPTPERQYVEDLLGALEQAGLIKIKSLERIRHGIKA